ncbi:MAG: hypothetical protein Q4F53_08880, partial [Nesterenkonia sp.]|nr:hypothetical protein [Nesterenkonia sp.]
TGTTHEHPEALLRAAVDDAVHLDDCTLAVLHQEQFTLLGGIGPAVWEAAGTCAGEAGIITALSESPDAPTDAVNLLQRAVEDLVTRGLLLRS